MSIDKEKYMKTMDALTDALGRSDGQTVEDIKNELRDDGIDVGSALERLKKAQLSISMAAKRSALDAARDKRVELVQKGREFIGKFSDWSKDQIMARIKELSGPKVRLAYRNLDAMETEEIISILEDLEMAHYRQNLEEGSNGE
ncbi:MAG: hypothetical protein LWW98_06020 [Deltaproteobacteria bacterium]|nr:hypothetical protein [Deltaproteobacteria bacterium]